MKNRKDFAAFLHMLFSLLVVMGVSIMYSNSHYGEGIRWITHETYEDNARLHPPA